MLFPSDGSTAQVEKLIVYLLVMKFYIVYETSNFTVEFT
jgi:hypothetical protein